MSNMRNIPISKKQCQIVHDVLHEKLEQLHQDLDSGINTDEVNDILKDEIDGLESLLEQFI